MIYSCPLCTIPTRLSWILYSASSLKQQSVDRHVDPLEYIIFIPSQPFFALFPPYCCMLSGEATNINLIVFGMIRLVLEPTIDVTRGDHAND